jgi:hypothetical protein
MFDDFAYRNYNVRAGVRQQGADGLGKWYGVISLVCETEQCVISLPDHLFDWPAAARRHAVGYARALIDSRLDGVLAQTGPCKRRPLLSIAQGSRNAAGS